MNKPLMTVTSEKMLLTDHANRKCFSATHPIVRIPNDGLCDEPHKVRGGETEILGRGHDAGGFSLGTVE